MSTPEKDPAQARYFAIQLVRLGGIALVIIGLLIAQGTLFEGAPRWIGMIVAGIGIVDTFFLPIVLARKWRSPKDN